jgi:hypothetical protein
MVFAKILAICAEFGADAVSVPAAVPVGEIPAGLTLLPDAEHDGFVRYYAGGALVLCQSVPEVGA